MARQKPEAWGILSDKQRVAWYELSIKSPATDIFWGGAAGGGKSALGTMWQQYRRIKYPGTRGFIGRDTLKNLKLTTLETYHEMWNKYFYRNPMGVKMRHNRNTDVIHFSNGSQIVLMELTYKKQSDPGFTKLGSLNLSDAFVDEAPGITEKAFLFLKARIRWRMPGGVPKILLTGNPANNWIKWMFVLDKKGRPVKLQHFQRFIKATLADNPDPKFVEAYMRQLKHLPPIVRDRLLYGDWTINENENPFFHEYSDLRHISRRPLAIDPYEPLYLSFDFNVSPCTCIVAQVTNETGLRVLKVHQVDGGTARLCDELIEFGYREHQAGVIATGDVSGKARHSSQASNEYGDLQTDYGIIKKKMVISDLDIRHTAHQNPRHAYSRRVCNHAFAQNVVTINEEGCDVLTTDLKAAKPTTNGDLYKNRDTGHGMDAADAFRYLINLVFPMGFEDINDMAIVLGMISEQDFAQDAFDSLRDYRKGN